MSGLPGPFVAMSVNRLGVRLTLAIGSLFTIAGAVMLATIVNNAVLATIAFGGYTAQVTLRELWRPLRQRMQRGGEGLVTADPR